MVDMGPPPGLPELSTYGRTPVSHSREQWSEDDGMPNQETHHLGWRTATSLNRLVPHQTWGR